MGDMNHTTEEKINIYVNKKAIHISYIDKKYLMKLNIEDIKPVRELILRKAKEAFGIDLKTQDGIQKLDESIQDLYKDRADWVRDIVRHELAARK